jgi:hypothetical protein
MWVEHFLRQTYMSSLRGRGEALKPSLRNGTATDLLKYGHTCYTGFEIYIYVL